MGVAGPPWVLASDGGLQAVVVAGGAPASMSVGDLELVQHPARACHPLVGSTDGVVLLRSLLAAAGARTPA